MWMVITFPEINTPTNFTEASLVAQIVKNPTMQETRVRSLGGKDPLVKDFPLQYSCLVQKTEAD